MWVVGLWVSEYFEEGFGVQLKLVHQGSELLPFDREDLEDPMVAFEQMSLRISSSEVILNYQLS